MSDDAKVEKAQKKLAEARKLIEEAGGLLSLAGHSFVNRKGPTADNCRVLANLIESASKGGPSLLKIYDNLNMAARQLLSATKGRQ